MKPGKNSLQTMAIGGALVAFVEEPTSRTPQVPM